MKMVKTPSPWKKRTNGRRQEQPPGTGHPAMAPDIRPVQIYLDRSRQKKLRYNMDVESKRRSCPAGNGRYYRPRQAVQPLNPAKRHYRPTSALLPPNPTNSCDRTAPERYYRPIKAVLPLKLYKQYYRPRVRYYRPACVTIKKYTSVMIRVCHSRLRFFVMHVYP